MIYVALAAYNEGKNIEPLLDSIEKVSKASGEVIRVIVVNDGSKDDTESKIKAFSGDVQVDCITQENAGFLKALTRALKEVVRVAKDDDICITMDADNTHPVDLIPDLKSALDRGSDVVIASRFQGHGHMVGVPFHRQVLSWGAKWVMRFLVPVKGVKDYSTAYRAYRVQLLSEVFNKYEEPLQGRGFSGIAGFLIRLQYLTNQISEVPLVLRYDFKQGESQMRIMDSFLGYMDIIWGYWTGQYKPNDQ